MFMGIACTNACRHACRARQKLHARRLLHVAFNVTRERE